MVKLVLVAAFVAALATAKIAPSVHRHLELSESVDVVVEFQDGNTNALQAASADLRSIQGRGPRIAHLRSLLVNSMESSQQAALELLSAQPEALSVRSEQFYISNRLFLYGVSRVVLDALAKLDGVAHIRSPVVAHLPVVDTEVVVDLPVVDTNSSILANEWGVNLIGAPSVWAGGNRGEGVVVGVLDTGAIYTHEAIKANYRATYGWFDPTDKSPTPIDTNGHGTHVVGTSVGANGIGVAPGATWIACRGCTTSSCPEAALTACAQFLLCPTDAQGLNPKCELAPHVINNSWGGGSGSSWYQANVNAWQAAGIIPVFANGNAGPNCGTANSPGDYKNVIGVGAVGSDDKLASFSSRGPARDGTLKPDVSAPGFQVRSAWNTGNAAYNTISGTSMASPHVTGAVALYLSRNKGAKYADVYRAFTTSVDTSTLTADNKNCGGVADERYPNNNYGYGRINVARAIGGGAVTPTTAPTRTPTTTRTTARPTPRPTPRPTTRRPRSENKEADIAALEEELADLLDN
ncbi:hypothetical protein DYB34_012094 [Aphanomyces astaci]|uniref:subtilisin n=1 Tax=Aphanomyces astaci TaxID=112090 RepID=A0A3R7DBD0_APHAT|nr:hypothetical protein DYB34_012094 [Aphanomyces astaci]